MSLSDFWHSEIRFILACIHGKQKEMTENHRGRYEAARLNAWWLVNINLKKKDRYRTPNDMAEFPWEVEIKKRLAKKNAKSNLAFIERMRMKAKQHVKKMNQRNG